MSEMSVADYRDLVRDALPSTVDSDTEPVDLPLLYTPDSHRRALEPDVTIVRGARGVGKTVWYKSLQEESLRQVAADSYQIPALTRVRPIRGYGTGLRPHDYPSTPTLQALLASGVEPANIWMTVLLKALGVPEVTERESWQERVEWAVRSPERMELALADADHMSRDNDQIALILFDALEHLHPLRREADRLTRGIFQLALMLRVSTRNIRAKVFIRPDMFESSSLDFADSSKLIANAADLKWSNTNLYGLCFHYLGNAANTRAADFRQATSPPTWREVTPGSRFVAPAEVYADRATQQEIFTGIAGQYMGTNHRKGYTYSWLPNHLMDGAEQVSPRSFLAALSTAARLTADAHSGHDRPLHYEAIRSGVQHASQIRVQEITEDIPWAATLVAALEGTQVPIERVSVRERWTESRVVDQLRDHADRDIADGKTRTGPRSLDLDGLIEELVELGVMSYRRDGRLDLPDVYRIAFNVGRKGGVPRIAR